MDESIRERRSRILRAVQGYEDQDDYSDYSMSHVYRGEQFLPSEAKMQQNNLKNRSFDEDDDRASELLDLNFDIEAMEFTPYRSEKKKMKLLESKKEKKKGKNKAGQPTDFNRLLAPEMNSIQSLIRQHNAFVTSMQSMYNQIIGTKSSNRGINKGLTDLMANITSARKVSADLVKQQSDIKKLAFEMRLKESKELGLGKESNSGSISDFSADFLGRAMSNRKAFTFDESSESDIEDYDDSDIGAAMLEQALSSNLQISKNNGTFNAKDRDDIVANAYLKYENLEPVVYAIVNREDHSDYDFIAKGNDGKFIEDYPVPMKNPGATVNESTNQLTDNLGRKFDIIWQ